MNGFDPVILKIREHKNHRNAKCCDIFLPFAKTFTECVVDTDIQRRKLIVGSYIHPCCHEPAGGILFIQIPCSNPGNTIGIAGLRLRCKMFDESLSDNILTPYTIKNPAVFCRV
jgi:hypothetical protein